MFCLFPSFEASEHFGRVVIHTFQLELLHYRRVVFHSAVERHERVRALALDCVWMRDDCRLRYQLVLNERRLDFRRR